MQQANTDVLSRCMAASQRLLLSSPGRPGVGQDIHASAAARAAVASASAIEGPRMITCDVCGVRLMLPCLVCVLRQNLCRLCCQRPTCIPDQFRQAGAKPKEPGSADAPLLCQVSFAKESGMQQHLAGPTHRKALERRRKEELRLQQLGNNRWAAENAAVRPPTSTPQAQFALHVPESFRCMCAAQLHFTAEGAFSGRGGHDDNLPASCRAQRRGRG